MKFVQDLTSKSVRFSGESTALGIGEANASPTQALREHAVLFLEIRDHVLLMALDPPGEHHGFVVSGTCRWVGLLEPAIGQATTTWSRINHKQDL